MDSAAVSGLSPAGAAAAVVVAVSSCFSCWFDMVGSPMVGVKQVAESQTKNRNVRKQTVNTQPRSPAAALNRAAAG
jgi:hypothetical protein